MTQDPTIPPELLVELDPNAPYQSFFEEDEAEETHAAVTIDEALETLRGMADAEKAATDAAYHKVEREYLGIPVPQITDLVTFWRLGLDLEGRIALATALWDSNIHEARIAAAKLLTQARIADDAAVWDLIQSWIPQLDGWAIADAVAAAGQKRLVAEPARLEQIEAWVTAPSHWTRRAALGFTAPWTKLNHPKAADLAIRDTLMGWCQSLAGDHDWFVQKQLAGWIRDLSRHDAQRARDFLSDNGAVMKPWALKEARSHLRRDK